MQSNYLITLFGRTLRRERGSRRMDVLRTTRQQKPLSLRYLFYRCLWKSVAVLGKGFIKAEDIQCLVMRGIGHHQTVEKRWSSPRSFCCTQQVNGFLINERVCLAKNKI